MHVNMQSSSSLSLKRSLPETDKEACSGQGVNGMVDCKRRKNAVTDVLVRQQLLSGLVRAKNVGKSHSDFMLSTHAETCTSSGECRFEECSLARKCLSHFNKCRKQDCIVCVEARLHQVIDHYADCSEDDKFTFSAWRARLQSVNDETREYVPYFNACAKELLVARTTRSPFVQAAKDRFTAAQVLVSQSERRYSELCSEIHVRWLHMLHATDDTASSDAGSCEESPIEGVLITQNKDENSPSCWRNHASDKMLRLKMLERIFEWSKATNPNSLLLGEKVLLDGARKAEALLYSVSASRDEYEQEAERMCQEI